MDKPCLKSNLWILYNLCKMLIQVFVSNVNLVLV